MTFGIITLNIECRYAESSDYLNVMLSVVMLNVVMLNVVMLNVVILPAKKLKTINIFNFLSFAIFLVLLGANVIKLFTPVIYEFS